MNWINKTDEKVVIGEETRLYSVQNKEAATFDSSDPSVREASKKVTSLDRNKLSDEELVSLFVENEDEEAFNEIVHRYADKIYRLALRITRNPSDAEDVLQEVFITLMKKLNSFHDESKFSTWLYRVAINASFMHLRAERKHKKDVSLQDYVSYDGDGILKGVEIKDWSDRPDEVLLSKEVMEIIEKAVSEVPERYRVIFHLRDIEGLSNEEVAGILGLSVPAVKSRIHRARLFLRDKLSDYFHEEQQVEPV